MSYNKKVTEYINGAPPGQIQILESLRDLIHQTIDGVTEEIKWGFPVFAKTKDFTYLRHSKKHVTLGFYNIDKIVDPDSVLEGSGNTLRHIKIKPADKINETLLIKWFQAIAL